MTWPTGSLPRALGCLALAALAYGIAPPPENLRTGLALFVLIGGLWITQALRRCSAPRRAAQQLHKSRRRLAEGATP